MDLIPDVVRRCLEQEDPSTYRLNLKELVKCRRVNYTDVGWEEIIKTEYVQSYMHKAVKYVANLKQLTSRGLMISSLRNILEPYYNVDKMLETYTHKKDQSARKDQPAKKDQPALKDQPPEKHQPPKIDQFLTVLINSNAEESLASGLSVSNDSKVGESVKPAAPCQNSPNKVVINFSDSTPEIIRGSAKSILEKPDKVGSKNKANNSYMNWYIPSNQSASSPPPVPSKPISISSLNSRTIDHHDTFASTSPLTFNHHDTIVSTSPVTFNHHDTFASTSPVTFNHHDTIVSTSPVTFNHHDTFASTSPLTFNHHDTFASTSPVTINHHDTFASTSPVTINHHDTFASTSPVTFNHHDTFASTSPVTINHHDSFTSTSPVTINQQAFTFQQIKSPLNPEHKTVLFKDKKVISALVEMHTNTAHVKTASSDQPKCVNNSNSSSPLTSIPENHHETLSAPGSVTIILQETIAPSSSVTVYQQETPNPSYSVPVNKQQSITPNDSVTVNKQATLKIPDYATVNKQATLKSPDSVTVNRQETLKLPDSVTVNRQATLKSPHQVGVNQVPSPPSSQTVTLHQINHSPSNSIPNEQQGDKQNHPKQNDTIPPLCPVPVYEHKIISSLSNIYQEVNQNPFISKPVSSVPVYQHEVIPPLTSSHTNESLIGAATVITVESSLKRSKIKKEK